ncbi:MAG: hypothetical protein QM767_27800 [Anaeromyxobacter sp.]
MTNPPYGERLGGGREGREERDGQEPRGERWGRGKREAPPPRTASEQRTADRKLEGFYRGLGEMLVRHSGWTAVILSGNPQLERLIPLRPEVDHRLWNGPLEAHLLKYRLP